MRLSLFLVCTTLCVAVCSDGLQAQEGKGGVTGATDNPITLLPGTFGPPPPPPCDPPPPCPCTEPLCFNVDGPVPTGEFCLTDGAPPPATPELCCAEPVPLDVFLLDCNGHTIATETHYFNAPCSEAICEGGSPISVDINDEWEFDICYGKLPKKICTQAYLMCLLPQFGGPHSCKPQAETKNGGPVCEAIPRPDLEDLRDPNNPEMCDCLVCEGGPEASHGRVKFYKSIRTLYTLPRQKNGSQIDGEGEVVNGEYTAPEKTGVLIIEVSGNDDILDVSVAGTPGGAGWWLPSGRQGSLVTEKARVVFSGSTGSRQVKFNVLARRGKLDAPAEILFRWFEWDDPDPQKTCCIREERESLLLEAEPLPCLVKVRKPVTARATRIPASGVPDDVEARIPCCPTCDGKPCGDGNLSGSFIVFPTSPGEEIGRGHAKGWRRTVAGLESPAREAASFEDPP